MQPGIIIPLVVLPIALIGAYVWYRRSMAALKPSEAKPVSGLRLTTEALHRAPSPRWRVVHEIGGALGTVEHVLVGPPGVIAVSTMVGDRPAPAEQAHDLDGARQLSAAAIARAPIDELVGSVGQSCSLSATVFWGTPYPDRPPYDEAQPTVQLVEGQRLDEWLDLLVTATTRPLDQPAVDSTWRCIVTGIGRPDPLA